MVLFSLKVKLGLCAFLLSTSFMVYLVPPTTPGCLKAYVSLSSTIILLYRVLLSFSPLFHSHYVSHRLISWTSGASLFLFYSSMGYFLLDPFHYFFQLPSLIVSLSISLNLVWQKWHRLIELSEVNLNLLKGRPHRWGFQEKGQGVVSFSWSCSWPATNVMQFSNDEMTIKGVIKARKVDANIQCLHQLRFYILVGKKELKNAVVVTPIVHIGQLDTLMALYWSLGWTGLCIRDQKVPFTWLQFTSAVCWTGTWEQQHDKTAKDDTTYWLKFSTTVFFRLLLVLFMLLFGCLRDDGWWGERGMRDYTSEALSLGGSWKAS